MLNWNLSFDIAGPWTKVGRAAKGVAEADAGIQGRPKHAAQTSRGLGDESFLCRIRICV